MNVPLASISSMAVLGRALRAARADPPPDLELKIPSASSAPDLALTRRPERNGKARKELDLVGVSKIFATKF